MDFNKGKEHSSVMKEVGPIQESGNKVKWMVMVFASGMTELNLEVNGEIVLKKGKGF